MFDRVLITGFTGQVGSQLAEFLLDKTNVEVYGFMRWQEPMDNISALTGLINSKKRCHIRYGDLNDFVSILRALDEVRPDVVFHLGAQSFPKTSFSIPLETLETNILGTAKLLEAIRYLENYNPIVHVCSSSEVYGKSRGKAIFDEESELHGASPYSISKIGTDFLGRFYAEAYNLRTFVTRMGTHSGPRRSDVFFESTVAKQIALIENNLQEKVIYVGNLESIRTYQDARDAVRAYYLLAEALFAGNFKPGEVFNIAGTEIFRLKEIVEILLSFTTVEGIEIVIDEERLRPIDADYQMFSCDKLRSVIDWTPEISVNVMLFDLLEHWRKEISFKRIPLNR